MREVRRGQMYYVSKGKDYMHERGTGRPAIVVSDNTMNQNADRIMVIYMTTQDKGRKENVPVDVKGTPSFAICENVNTIFKDRLQQYIGTVPQDTMVEISRQMLNSLGIRTAKIPIDEKESWKNKPICIGCHEKEKNKALEKAKETAEKEKSAVAQEAKFWKRAYNELLEKVMVK